MTSILSVTETKNVILVNTKTFKLCYRNIITLMVLSSESVATEVSDESELESSSPSNCRFSRFLGVEGSAVGSSTEMN